MNKIKSPNKIFFNFGSPDKRKYKEITADQLEDLLQSVYAYYYVKILGEFKFDREKYPNISRFINVMGIPL